MHTQYRRGHEGHSRSKTANPAGTTGFYGKLHVHFVDILDYYTLVP